MNPLIEEISKYIHNLFNTQFPSSFLYHNLQHTKDVADIVNEIAENLSMADEEKEMLLIAAWFHDSGYFKSINNHEQISAGIAEDFLKVKNYPPEKISEIKQIILATKVPQRPQNIYEEILCDADLLYIGSDGLMEKIELLRQEWKNTIGRAYTNYDWIKQNIDFIEANLFHTDYARKKFGEIRMSNLNKLKKKASELNKNHL